MNENNEISRRDFIKRTAVGTAGLSLGGSIYGGTGAAADVSGNLLADVIRAGESNNCRPWTPRAVLMPHCRLSESDNGPAFQVESNGSIGCHGGWELVCNNVTPGKTYRVRLTARLENIAHPVEDISPEIFFMGADGKITDWYFIEAVGSAGEVIEFEHRAVAPPETARIVIRLILRWTAHGSATFTNIQLTTTDPIPDRKIRVSVAAGLKQHRTIEANIDNCLATAARAADKGARLILFPEIVTSMGVPGDNWDKARPIPGPETDRFAAFARDKKICISLSMEEANGDIVHNTGLVFDSEGRIRLKYRKLQIAIGERWRGITPGDSLPVATLPFGCVGMQICYDNAHPETMRVLARQGAEIVLLPIMGDPRASVEGIGWVREKWEWIMRMRALDNHVWLLVARNEGELSYIINPAGDIVASMNKGQDLITADIDLNFRTWSWIDSDFYNRYWRERRPSAYESMSSTDFRITPQIKESD
ncbi:nitrilase-related carbon-nitrogen hydrolase [candidate division KSB1 bacterium]